MENWKGFLYNSLSLLSSFFLFLLLNTNEHALRRGTDIHVWMDISVAITTKPFCLLLLPLIILFLCLSFFFNLLK